MIGALSYSKPFGGRKMSVGSSGSYTYGFNGQLKDDEVYGEGNSYTAEFWQYDPRLGRRWNVDPVDQISISNYACFKNNPVYNIDKNGAKPDGWIENKETGEINWDKDVNSDSQFANSAYDKSKFNYLGQEGLGETIPGGGVQHLKSDGTTSPALFRREPIEITSTTFPTSLKDTRNAYWDNGNYVKAIEYDLKYRTGKTNDQSITPERGYKIMGGTVGVVTGILTCGAAPLAETGIGVILSYTSGGVSIANGLDDTFSDGQGNSGLQQIFPENSKEINSWKSVATLGTGWNSFRSGVISPSNRPVDVISSINDIRSLIMGSTNKVNSK